MGIHRLYPSRCIPVILIVKFYSIELAINNQNEAKHWAGGKPQIN